MSAEEFDVVVLGGGTAGTAAAKAAAESGARTVMFNDGELGGLCILRGCMPTKTLLHAAHLVHEARHHHTPGVGHGELDVDFDAVMGNKSAKVARFKRAKIQGIERGGYEVVDARAAFSGRDTVKAGGKEYRFTKGAVIAAGSVQFVPPVDGLDQVPYWTSDTVMALETQPSSLVVVGSGAIGLELAQFFSRIGTRVTLLSRRPVFQDVDPLVVEEMAAALDAEPNFERLAEWKPLRVSERPGGGVTVDVEGPDASRTIEADAILVATGRKAAVEGLGLDAAGVDVKNGRVVCGADMQTSNPNVFVAGDVTGNRLLLHVANWEGRVAGLGAAQVPGEHAVEQRLHMEVVFTDPPMAMIGMTEAQAREAGHDVVTASARASETGRAITMDVQHGALKLVADKASGEILGGQFLCPRADDIVHVISSIMFYRGTAAQMLDMPWYHPTVTEVLLSLARELEGKRLG